MSKAEERALEKYPDYRGMDGGYVTQRNKRMVYIEGYHQAEKDIHFDLIHKMQECKEKIESGFLNDIEIDIQDFKTEKDNELTWEDISIIRQIMFDHNRQVRNEMTIPNDEEYCQEVLKRFKAMKEKL